MFSWVEVWKQFVFIPARREGLYNSSSLICKCSDLRAKLRHVNRRPVLGQNVHIRTQGAQTVWKLETAEKAEIRKHGKGAFALTGSMRSVKSRSLFFGYLGEKNRRNFSKTNFPQETKVLGMRDDIVAISGLNFYLQLFRTLFHTRMLFHTNSPCSPTQRRFGDNRQHYPRTQQTRKASGSGSQLKEQILSRTCTGAAALLRCARDLPL